MTTSTEVLIAAHGEAWTGSPDGTPAPGSLAGLSADGARQSRLLAAALAREAGVRGGFGAVYSCPSLRCLETAGPVAAVLGLDLRVAPELRTPEAEMLTGAGALIPAPRRTDESGWWGGYVQRAGRFILSLPRTHGGQRVLVVGHGATQRAAITVFLRLPAASAWWGAPLAHGGLSRWVHRDDSVESGGIWALTRHNDTAHLSLPDTRPQPPQLAELRRARERT